MNIAIVGSRSFEDYDALVKFIKSKIDIREVEVVVSGGAKGADALAERFAHQYELGMRVIYPNWQRHGKAAGPIRNKMIVEFADVVFAFWDGESRGTLSTINYAKQLSKQLYICNA
jgi:predicted Rossmann fold nucleotide-binding protein DprA/Smf involved in DNA uptake